jgi:hypothetical protein
VCFKELAVRIIPFIAAVSTLAAAATANPELTLRYVAFMPGGHYGLSENPNVDGVGMMRYNSSGYTRVNVVLHGLQPQTTYGIKVTSQEIVDGYAVWHFGLNTNSDGMGNFSGQFLGFVRADDRVDIEIFIDNGSRDRIITNCELRAFSLSE